jgi:ParB family chromosome partitioning protein
LKFDDDAVRREIAAKCVAEGWSVRQIEAFTKPTTLSGKKEKSDTEPPVDPNVKFAIDEMQRVLGTKVRIIEKGAKKGQIEIEFYSEDDLNRIYDAIIR